MSLKRERCSGSQILVDFYDEAELQMIVHFYDEADVLIDGCCDYK